MKTLDWRLEYKMLKLDRRRLSDCLTARDGHVSKQAYFWGQEQDPRNPPFTKCCQNEGLSDIKRYQKLSSFSMKGGFRLIYRSRSHVRRQLQGTDFPTIKICKLYNEFIDLDNSDYGSLAPALNRWQGFLRIRLI